MMNLNSDDQSPKLRSQEPPETSARLSREGIPFRDYQWVEVLLGVLVGWPILLYSWFVGWTVREEPVDFSDVPPNAIVYGWHQEGFLVTVTPGLLRPLRGRLTWLAFHGFLSYFGSLWTYSFGLSCFRYRLKAAQTPLEQTLDYLKSNPDRILFIRTDAGKPYNRVRPSLARMSEATGRPVVAFRQRAWPSFRVNGHAFPLPFARVKTVISEPLEARQLAGLEKSEAQQLLQAQIDSLVLDPGS